MRTLNAEATMVEWPQKRRHQLSNAVRIPPRLADIPAELLRAAEETSAFNALIQALVDAFYKKTDPQAKLTERLRLRSAARTARKARYRPHRAVSQEQ
jgi:hypothetical protein